MLLDNFPPMTGAASPNRVGVVDGGKDQHGRAARGGVGGDGALPVGQTGGEGADARRGDEFGDGGTDCACAIGDERRGTIEMRCKLGVARDIRDIWRASPENSINGKFLELA